MKFPTLFLNWGKLYCITYFKYVNFFKGACIYYYDQTVKDSKKAIKPLTLH